MKALIVGMGIGQLYKTVLEQLNFSTVTVDPVKSADFTSVGLALDMHPKFDISIICTPNHTHEQIAYLVSSHSLIIMVEKPGVRTARDWEVMVESCPKTRFMMVKNNQYRDEMPFFKTLSKTNTTININWINRNRIPNPGTWFTNIHYSFGGVSRDLMTHLLSIVAAIKPSSYRDCRILNLVKEQRWDLKDITDTEYGAIDPYGKYNVDDYCNIQLEIDNLKFNLTADWRSMTKDDQSITFFGDRERRFELGLCPESAYLNMIEAAVVNLNKKDWWRDQLEQDLWIHNMIGPYDEK
jgi:predicted dehydrogenase